VPTIGKLRTEMARRRGNKMMEWTQTLTIIFSISGLFLWSIREARADRRNLDNKFEAGMRESRGDMKEFREDMKKFRETWAQEVKDFHARLFSLEERRKK
jgi:hypothetical protein